MICNAGTQGKHVSVSALTASPFFSLKSFVIHLLNAECTLGHLGHKQPLREVHPLTGVVSTIALCILEHIAVSASSGHFSLNIDHLDLRIRLSSLVLRATRLH